MDQLARLLRRSPAAVRKALHAEQAFVIERDEVLAKMLALSEPLNTIRRLLSDSIKHPKA